MIINKFTTLFLTTFGAGLLLLSTAGVGVSSCAFIAFIPLLYAIDYRKLNPIIIGTLYGFLYWVFGLSWMLITFTHFGNAPFIGSIALLLTISIISGFLFFAPFTYIAAKYKNPLLLSMVFIALEAIKGAIFFGGVPWLNLAQSQYKNILVLQFVSFFGEYGLSFVIILINILLYYIIINYNRKKYILFLIITIIVMLTPGVYRLIIPLKYDTVKNILIIQTGIKQEDKWDKDSRIKKIYEINQQLMSVDRKKYDLIILPENSYPARALNTKLIMDVLNNISYDLPIIFGTDRMEKDSGKKKYYNSMIMINNEKLQIYDKIQLTPFGEYFPFENILKPLREFFFGTGPMFSAGTTQKILEANEIKVAPLICFESAFSKLLDKPIDEGANIISIISNDSWFGESQGRKQHLAVDVVRAVEYARAIVRSTQNGITAVILPNGKVAKILNSKEAGQIDYKLPLISFKTLYSKYGYIWIAITLPIIYYLIRRKRSL